MVYFYAEAEAKKENFIPVNSKDKWYCSKRRVEEDPNYEPVIIF